MAGRATTKAAGQLPLGVRKMIRLIEESGKTWSGFAKDRGIDRFKLLRMLHGEMKRIDIDFIAQLVRAWPQGTLNPLDFAQSTVKSPDTGAVTTKPHGKSRSAA